MDKIYNPSLIEQKWYQTWEKAGYFAPRGKGKTYTIVLPPPNVTGTLHMGHGFQLSLMDALIRYHRMQGYNTLWQVGIDHAGISTQMVVEKQLVAEGKSRHDIGRDAFLDRVWAWKEKSSKVISHQLRRMGSSLDWSTECFTLDEARSHAVQEEFIHLYEEGLIYRGNRLVNWDPVLHTAISDLEVLSEKESGYLWYIRYPLVNSNNYITVATTRPETMLGDAAIAVHPVDDRYKTLIGQAVKLPLTDRNIPILADNYVDPKFGTGCLKITPAHDFNDYEVGQRHGLPLINIFTIDAKLNENAPLRYQNIDRFEARKHIIADLKAAGLLEKTEPHILNVPRGDRSGAIIEPYLTSQWFVKTKPLAKPAINAVKKGKIIFIPTNWTKVYFQWLENIQDWCISRQLWWGHRIPAWYDEKGNIYVGRDEEDIRKKHKLSSATKLAQDEDVLDTWFSAALWPFSTLGWPEKTTRLKTFYPTHVLVTAFDIIFFWVARMVMMGLKFTGKVPFHEVYITGLIRDSEGQKMSKSKGNILDPIDLVDGVSLNTLIEKRTMGLMQPTMAEKIKKLTEKEFPNGIPSFGTDSLRFTFCALASGGRDINFSLKRLEGNRNFCNKLWNAARYVLINTEDYQHDLTTQKTELNLADRWIRTRLQETIKIVHLYFTNYRFDLLAQTLYDFTWHDYCDWYLEFCKPILTDEHNQTVKAGTRQTLIYVLETLLRLMHPLMPFITEEIWQWVAPLANKKPITIMLEPYPKFDKCQLDKKSVEVIDWLKRIIESIRNIRGEMNVSPSKKIILFLRKGTKKDKEHIKKNQTILKTLSKLNSINWLSNDETPPPSAAAIVDTLELYIPMSGLIDKDAELKRLNKEVNRLEKDLANSQNKLQNSNYINKAPIDLVNKEKQRVEEITTTLNKLQAQLKQINTL